MICSNCEDAENKQVEMEVEEVVTDYHDPNDSHGHGQYTSKVWVCPECDEQEDYIPDDDLTFYDLH